MGGSSGKDGGGGGVGGSGRWWRGQSPAYCVYCGPVKNLGHTQKTEPKKAFWSNYNHEKHNLPVIIIHFQGGILPRGDEKPQVLFSAPKVEISELSGLESSPPSVLGLPEDEFPGVSGG
jgi:hypothetical protein